MFNKSNYFCGLVFIIIIVQVPSFTLTLSKADAVTKCANDDDCTSVCFIGGELQSRCDSDGVCVCDCHDEKFVNASYTPACQITQPEGDVRDNCNKYCTQQYIRPSRFCTNSNGKTFCTAVCNFTR